MTDHRSTVPTRGRHAGQVAVAIGVVLLGVLVLWATGQIPLGAATSSRIGPRFVPYIAGAGLVLVGLALLWAAWRGGWTVDDEGRRIDGSAEPLDRAGLAWFVAGLAINVLLIELLGFVIAGTLLFFCVARGFGSRRPLRDLGIGFAIALAAYLGFDRLFGISLGLGTLWGVA